MIVRRRCSQMAVRSALRANRALPPGTFVVLIYIRGYKAIAVLEGLGQLRGRMTWGIEPATSGIYDTACSSASV
jgi:hypothetical protein